MFYPRITRKNARTLVLCVTLSVVGCSALPLKNEDVTGTYSQSDIDAELHIRISKDGTYDMFALLGWKMTEGPDGVARIPTEPRERGQWRLTGTTIILSPENGQDRTMQVRMESGVPVLRNRQHSFKLLFRDNTIPPSE